MPLIIAMTKNFSIIKYLTDTGKYKEEDLPTATQLTNLKNNHKRSRIR